MAAHIEAITELGERATALVAAIAARGGVLNPADLIRGEVGVIQFFVPDLDDAGNWTYDEQGGRRGVLVTIDDDTWSVTATSTDRKRASSYVSGQGEPNDDLDALLQLNEDYWQAVANVAETALDIATVAAAADASSIES